MNTEVMNQRITIQKKTITTSANGFASESWSDYYSCWAYVNNLSGSEFWSAYAANASETVQFSIKYCSKSKCINSIEYRLVFRGRAYDITFVDNVRYENETIKIKAVAIS